MSTTTTQYAMQYKLTELELAKLEIIKLKEQLLAAHREILSMNEKGLIKDCSEVRNKIIISRNVDGTINDTLIDDIKGVLIVQAKANKVASQEKEVRQ